ncbi:hypothetical protein BDV29DRAFT_176794 [Aspergillus leporis]|uniref:Uncharacterized protein n=1 Tax=Aspergillus leporis TaxID=41062 RepID=A0A5N5WW09_9EURO|nr:hypothetical protein BDV29DRAFT_176794 [Aspergillus leporis]
MTVAPSVISGHLCRPPSACTWSLFVPTPAQFWAPWLGRTLPRSASNGRLDFHGHHRHRPGLHVHRPTGDIQSFLLEWLAKLLRELTGDDRYQAEHASASSLRSRLLSNVYRPFIMTWTESTILVSSFYLVLLYFVFFTFQGLCPGALGQRQGLPPGNQRFRVASRPARDPLSSIFARPISTPVPLARYRLDICRAQGERLPQQRFSEGLLLDTPGGSMWTGMVPTSLWLRPTFCQVDSYWD